MHQRERFAFGFPIGKKGLGSVQAKCLLTLLPNITPNRKRLIVDPAAFLKLLLKKALLAFDQMQTVLICGFTQLSHIPIIAYNWVERKCETVLISDQDCISVTACIPGFKARGFLPPFL
jgi:hypothetical protein